MKKLAIAKRQPSSRRQTLSDKGIESIANAIAALDAGAQKDKKSDEKKGKKKDELENSEDEEPVINDDVDREEVENGSVSASV